MAPSSIASSVSSYLRAPSRPEGYGRLTQKGRGKVDACSDPAVEELLPKIRRRKWRQNFVSIFIYLFNSLRSWLGKGLLSPSTFFLDPVGTIASIIVLHPLIFLGLCGAACSLYIASLLTSRTSQQRSGFSFSRKVSIINWPNVGLFESEEAKKVLKSARPTLSGLFTTFRNAPPPMRQAQVPCHHFETTRIFDVDVAKTLLMLSALVYERLDEMTSLAYEYGNLGKAEEANTLRRLSVQYIRVRARELGLRFEALNEPGVWGPFASFFYTQENDEKPFIILALKGTTPDNFAEFLIDARISRVSSAVFFGDGTVHEGFMRELFVMEHTSDPNNRVRDYDFITSHLRLIAQQLRKEGGPFVQVWVTGHSLGSALASLLFARYLRVPSDLGDDIELRDCYAFGTPRLGDAAFVSKVEESLASPVGRSNILWRVVNNWDIVCKVPPGCANRELRRASLTPFSVLNYGHLGVEVSLDSSKEGYTIRDRAFHNTTRVLVVKDTPSGPKVTSRRKLNFSGPKKDEPVERLFSWMPSVIWDHFPASYWNRLDAMSAPYRGGEARGAAGPAGTYRRDWMSPAQEQEIENTLKEMEGYDCKEG